MSYAASSTYTSTADDRQRRFRRPTAVLGVALVNIVIIAVFSLTTPNHVFFEVQTIPSVLVNASQIVLLGVGVACLLGAGQFDISLGANLILSSVVGARVMAGVATIAPTGVAIVVGIVVCILTGATFGLVNGLLVARLGINSLIATLGMLGIGGGLALVIANGVDLVVPSAIQTGFGIVRVFDVIPAPSIVTAVIVLAVYLLISRTRFGLRALAVGSSRESAARSGIDVQGTTVKLFVLAGALAGVAGVIDLSRFTTTSVSGHATDALAAVAGAVIGGTALFGGRVSIMGTVLGCILPVILAVGLVMQGLPPFYQQIAIGAVLIVAVALRTAQAKRT
ncbi:ABC transporter permease [Microbacterium jepli]|uniref:ABC transporter permease n=1 Tax=Microbacterium sp. 1P10UE TaxID=3132288 RepID=UPI0039A070A8